VEEGYARAYTKYPCSREAVYLEAQQRAQAAKRRLWALESVGAALPP
jgi:endonuclease YncB( thermonuclease family)